MSAGSQIEYGTTTHDDGSNQSTQLFMNHDGLVDTHFRNDEHRTHCVYLILLGCRGKRGRGPTARGKNFPKQFEFKHGR